MNGALDFHWRFRVPHGSTYAGSLIRTDPIASAVHGVFVAIGTPLDALRYPCQ